MTRRKNLAVFFGGRSGEHVVSLRSAASIMGAVDRERYKIIPVGITREGRWLVGDDVWQCLWEKRNLEEQPHAALSVYPSNPGLLIEKKSNPGTWNFQPLDLAFPVLHGTYGEDGAMQGLLEMAGIPYVGSGILSSAAAMDKATMKVIFQEHNLPVGPYLYFRQEEWTGREGYWQKKIGESLDYPCFVKPANLGSSVGITKVKKKADLVTAVKEALLYDNKVIAEAHIPGREIECSVLGNLDPLASRPGEVVPCNEFYDYRAKYIDDKSSLLIPADIGPDLEQRVQELSCAAFKAVEASGLARVDFFLEPGSEKIIINEINTMPGFTSISMYPKLWEVSGIGYNELLERLLDLAGERFQQRRALRVLPPE